MTLALPTDEDKNTFLDAEKYENTADIEQAWVSRAVQHMEVHFNLISSINPTMLKLTPHDEQIYTAFQREFPEFKLDILEEGSLKREENKQKWNTFCNEFKDKVDDALFGTLVRINCQGTYSEDNTIFVVRIQFLAIEIARNRLGLNNTVYENNKRKRDK